MSNHLRDVTEKYEAELDRLRAEIRYRDATIRDQAERLRAAVGDGVRCERMVNEGGCHE